MSSRRKLLSTSSRSGSRRPQASHPANDAAAAELPPYQSPSYPLSATGQRQLKELSNSGLNDKLLKHTKDSAKLLGTTIWAINERMTNRKKEVSDAAEREAKRRRVDGDNREASNAPGDVEKAEAKAKELEEMMLPLTLKVEAAMREVLDMQAALQDEKEMLVNLPQYTAMRQEARADEVGRNMDDAEDGAEQPEIPGVAILEIWEHKRDAAAAEYEKLSAYEKYAKNNAYIDFKRQWHEGLYPDEVPVPDPKTWFDRDGQPQHVVRAGADEDDSDAEIQIAREKRSFRCPLSLVTMTAPYTSRKCKHSFQKEAIMDFIKGGPRGRATEKPCPETGCNTVVSHSSGRARNGPKLSLTSKLRSPWKISILMIHCCEESNGPPRQSGNRKSTHQTGKMSKMSRKMRRQMPHSSNRRPP